MPTLATTVDGLRELPFASTHVIGLVTSPAAWKDWFESRQFADETERQKRIDEAAISVEWLLGDSRASIVTNAPSHPEVAADHVVRIVDHDIVERDESTAEVLLGYIKSIERPRP